jgi:two-component system sensor histidine kinase CiaH
MKRIFKSATLKLTASYLLILIITSLAFSFIIFELSTNEISRRLERLQIRVEGSGDTVVVPGPLTLNDVRLNQTEEARNNIFFGLLYMNFAVVGLGGIGAYILARRTIQPLQEAHEAQSRFSSDASHELRTPLAVMKSEIQVALRDKTLNKKDLKELLESNLEEVDKLTELSHALLQLSRLDYGNITRADNVELVSLLKKRIGGFDVNPDRIKLNNADSSVTIEGNEPMIDDLMRILLDNALKYSPKQSQIDVQLTTNGRTARIVVSNPGDGIDPKELDRIFDRFYRTDRSRSTQGQKGYGLGLSLAKNIVELHDGSISAQSTPGEITRFIVSLPKVRKNR